MDGITMSFAGEGGRGVKELFAACGDPGPALDDFGGYKQRQIVLSMPKRPILMSAPAGDPPGRHSGGFAHTITWNRDGAKLEVGSADVRAGILQEGGTIEAQDRLLTIPISEESYGKRARDFPDLVLTFRKTAAGLMIGFLVREHSKIVRTRMSDERGTLVERGGKQFRIKQAAAQPDFLFVLKRSVEIEAHPYLEWTDEDYDELTRAICRHWNAS